MTRISYLRQYSSELQVCDKNVSVEELIDDEKRLFEFCKILRAARDTVGNGVGRNSRKGKKKRLVYISIFGVKIL